MANQFEELGQDLIPKYKWDELFNSPQRLQSFLQENGTQPVGSTTNVYSSNDVFNEYGGAFTILGNELRSPGFISGQTGWRLKSGGNFEANSGIFRGALEANSLDIPDKTTADSFHVATDGDVWWGATLIGSAVGKVEKDGKATFTDIVATGTINAQAGYLSEGVEIGTTNAILCESAGLNVGVAGHIRGGQTDYNVGNGFFLGYSSSSYKLSIGDAYNCLKWDGKELTLLGANDSAFVASSNVRNFNDTEQTTTNQSYTKIKEILIREKITAFKLYWQQKVSAGGHQIHVRMYKNGTGIGTEAISNASGYVDVNYDYTTTFENGDLLQLYAYADDVGYTAYVHNMRVEYDRTITAINGVTLTTPLATTQVIVMTNQDP